MSKISKVLLKVWAKINIYTSRKKTIDISGKEKSKERQNRQIKNMKKTKPICRVYVNGGATCKSKGLTET